MWNPNIYDCECNKACKIVEYLNIKSCLCKKHLSDKLELVCPDEIWNTIEATSFVDKQVKNDGFIHTMLLVIICLSLLVAISFSCYPCYVKALIKK